MTADSPVPADKPWPPENFEPLLCEIGRIVFNWNTFERTTTRLLNHLIGGGHKATILTAHMGSNTQLDALRTLGNEFLKGEQKTHCLHVIALFERLRERRNFYVHSFNAILYPLMNIGPVTVFDDSNPVAIMQGYSARGRLKFHESNFTHNALKIEALILKNACQYIALVSLNFTHPENETYRSLPQKFPLPDRLTKPGKFPLDEPNPPQSSLE